MEANTILVIILSITFVSYLFDQILDYINLKAQRADIPKEIEESTKGKVYEVAGISQRPCQIFFCHICIQFLLSFGMLISGGLHG